MRKNKNIVFDIDGTIAFNGQKVSEEIADAICLKRTEGFNIILATARPVRDTLPLLPESLRDVTIVGCKAIVLDREDVSHTIANLR